MKEGDIFRWQYNHKTLLKMNDGDNGGTTYWCKSQIAIVNKDGLLCDTYWGYSNFDSLRFSSDQVKEKLDLKFIANINDLVKSDIIERAYYLDADCVDLNHPNSTIGNFYIRKGAVKNLEKINRLLDRGIKKVEKEISYQLSQIESMKSAKKELTSESRLHVLPNDLNLNDTCWDD